MIEINRSEEAYILPRKTFSENETVKGIEKNLYRPVSIGAKCSLIIPAYNEEERIIPFLKSISKNLSDFYEILIISDGTDNTAKIAKSIDSKFKVVEYDHRLGKGGAIIEGFKLSSGDIIGYVDADGAISSDEIRKVFSSAANGSDASVGSRWVKGAQIKTKQPLGRIILGRIYHYMSFAILGVRTKDTQCGIKAFKSSVLKRVLSHVTVKNLSFDTALLYHCQKLNINVTEVPIVWQNVNGSKVRPIRTSLVMLLFLVGLRIAHSNSTKKLDPLLVSIQEVVELI